MPPPYVGDLDGERDGEWEGDLLGLLVVGDCEGERDGDFDGLLMVGEVLGVDVVGDLDGEREGDADVGRSVGEAVGSVPSTQAQVRATVPAHVPAPPALSQLDEVIVVTPSWLFTAGELVV